MPQDRVLRVAICKPVGRVAERASGVYRRRIGEVDAQPTPYIALDITEAAGRWAQVCTGTDTTFTYYMTYTTDTTT